MNLVKFRNALMGNTARSVLGFALMLGATAAMAGAADPGAAISAEVDNAKTVITGILVTLAGVVGLFILWSYLKKAK